MRALEVARAGAAVLEQARWRNRHGPYEVSYFGLTMDRRALASRLETRAAAFAAAGLLHEVQRLLAWGYHPELPALQSIGYREFVRVARGTMAADEAVRLMQRDTVRYAKRQWTWFAREPGIEWIDVDESGGADGAAERIATSLEQEGVTG
jgi:tRNA dimethylallyltransferase